VYVPSSCIIFTNFHRVGLFIITCDCNFDTLRYATSPNMHCCVCTAWVATAWSPGLPDAVSSRHLETLDLR